MRRKNTLLTYLLLSMLGIALTVLHLPLASAQTRQAARSGREVYRGNIFYIGGARGSVTDFFTLTINGYTPDAEVNRLTGILKRDGQDDFWKAVAKEKRGTIQIGSGLSRDLNAVWITQTEDGRRISAIAERWIGFGESVRGTRSLDYPFTYIELYVEDDGKVEGSVFPAARVRVKGDKTIEVENFGIYPARLTNIKQRRK